MNFRNSKITVLEIGALVVEFENNLNTQIFPSHFEARLGTNKKEVIHTCLTAQMVLNVLVTSESRFQVEYYVISGNNEMSHKGATALIGIESLLGVTKVEEGTKVIGLFKDGSNSAYCEIEAVQG